MNLAQKNRLAKEDFALWAENMAILPDSEAPVDLIGRPYWQAPYESEAQHIALRKASQVGGSTLAILKSLWGARYRWPLGFAHYLPHKVDIGDLVRQKVDPIIDATPSLSHHAEMGFGTKGAANLGSKKVGRSFGFYRGIDSTTQRKVISVDLLVFDEISEMIPDHIEETMHRLDASDLKMTMKMGIPSVPGAGSDAAFQVSTQNHWTMTCRPCKKEWTVEEAWPDCVKVRHGHGYPVCPKCGAKTNINRGRWIPREPGRSTEGYTINGLMNPKVDIAAFLETYRTGSRHLFLRHGMGIPSRETGGKIIEAEWILGNLCGGQETGREAYAQILSDKGPTCLGADVGGSERTSRAIVGKILPNGRTKILRIWSWKDWSELDDAMEAFHVERAVVDAQPELRNAETFCKSWRRQAFRCWYRQGRKHAMSWDEKTGVVEADRTATLDASFDRLYNDLTALPRRDDPEVRLFAKECEKLERVEEETPTGSKVAVWNKTGDDHGRHAQNYMEMALVAERPKARVEVF